MKNHNNCSFSGRLTKDAELRYINSGTAVCNFSLAYNRSIKKGDNWEDKSCFIECTLWGKLGETLTPMLTKGKSVIVAGELDHERWEQDGVNRSKHKLIIGHIELTGGKPKGDSAPGGEDGGEQSPDYEDEIPF